LGKKLLADEGETLEAGVTVADREMFRGWKNIYKFCSAPFQIIIPFQKKENLYKINSELTQIWNIPD